MACSRVVLVLAMLSILAPAVHAGAPGSLGQLPASFSSVGQSPITIVLQVRPASESITLIGNQSGGIPAAPTTGRRYIVQRGDSLSKIALRFYGSYFLWPLIFQANRDQIRDPDLIHPGQELLLPDLAPGMAEALVPPVVGPAPGNSRPDAQLVALAQAGAVTTQSPGFSSWFGEALSIARAEWGMPHLTNRYGRAVTEGDLLRTILYIESRGIQQDASGRTTTSSAGALGFMQLMPNTARGVGVDPRDPRQNLLGGARYLGECFASNATRVPGDTAEDRIAKAAACYNVGPYDRKLARETWQEYLQNGVPETIRYGILTKMALGFELSPMEESWMARDKGVSVTSIPQLSVSTYSKTQELV